MTISREEMKARLDNWFETVADYGDERDKEAYKAISSLIDQREQQSEEEVGELVELLDWHIKYWESDLTMRRENKHVMGLKKVKSLLAPKVVPRGFVVNSARIMGIDPDALAMVLREAGVIIKEG